MTSAKTWTCRSCRAAQIELREIRIFDNHPKWLYLCPTPGCGTEAVATYGPVGNAPLFAWLVPAGEDDSEIGGRVATDAERAGLGDILAENSARDYDGRRVTWQ